MLQWESCPRQTMTKLEGRQPHFVAGEVEGITTANGEMLSGDGLHPRAFHPLSFCLPVQNRSHACTAGGGMP